MIIMPESSIAKYLELSLFLAVLLMSTHLSYLERLPNIDAPLGLKGFPPLY